MGLAETRSCGGRKLGLDLEHGKVRLQELKATSGKLTLIIKTSLGV